MDRRLWKQDDEHKDGIVREIRNGGVMVRRGEDVDCKRSGANEARVVACGVGEWHSVAGREDCVTDDGGRCRGRSGRRFGEQDDDEFGDTGGGTK